MVTTIQTERYGVQIKPNMVDMVMVVVVGDKNDTLC